MMSLMTTIGAGEKHHQQRNKHHNNKHQKRGKGINGIGSGAGGTMSTLASCTADANGLTSTGATKYKWATELVAITHSAFQLLVNLLLSFLLQAWHWTVIIWNNSQELSFSVLAQYLTSLWTSLSATMTIELITADTITTTNSDPDSNMASKGDGGGEGRIVIPTLRLNSENIEDYYTPESKILSEVDEELVLNHNSKNHRHSCCSASSNYNTSSEGEQDSGLVFTDPEENYDDSTDGLISPFPGENATGHIHNHIPPEPISNGRRDSDSSDISSDGHEQDETTKGKSTKDHGLVESKLIAQVESMFSNEHLEKDGFLLKHVRRRSDGFVSLKLVAGLRKVKQISRDFDVILSTLRKSEKLEINADGTKIRRTEPLTQHLKTLPVAGTNNKDKENKAKTNNASGAERQGHWGYNSNGASSDSAQDDFASRVNGRNNQKNGQGYGQQHKKVYRKDSNYSSCSSNGGSRHGSFSMPQAHSGNEYYRNLMVYPPGEEGPQQMNRRRGGSLPMPMVTGTGEQQSYLNFAHQHYTHIGPHGQRNSMQHVYGSSPTNCSPPNGSGFQQRPKSNSYCEGFDRKNSTGGMSLWLQRRLANSRTSEGNIVVSGVIRQPRGPDGTKGFASGYRELIIKERATLST